MPREYKRADRVSEVLQREIGSLLLNGVKDPRIGMVTITGVKTSDDLKHATVYFTMHGDEAARVETQKGLHSAVGFFRSHLRKATELRYVPDLHFRYDVSLDEGERIDRLLREVQERDGK